jgi:hypothetical protein
VSPDETTLAVQLIAETILTPVNTVVGALGALLASSASVVAHEFFKIMLTVMLGPIREPRCMVRLARAVVPVLDDVIGARERFVKMGMMDRVVLHVSKLVIAVARRNLSGRCYIGWSRGNERSASPNLLRWIAAN